MQNSSFDKHILLQFKSGLREQQRDLLETIEKAERELQEFAGPAPSGAIELSCVADTNEPLFGGASQDHLRLQLIQQALERIKDGTFGICAHCQAPIGLKRLQVTPWARSCIDCQEQAEGATLASYVAARHDQDFGIAAGKTELAVPVS
jgi:DnaK suppressor protein